MLIEYIYHSSFRINMRDENFLFDYYRGELPKMDLGKVFISHSHKDHYNPEVLKLKGDFQYFLSDDIVLENPSVDNFHFLKPNQSLKYENMNINSFGSTDLGISMHICVDNVNIFFAGDLNLWIWPEDSEDERKQMNSDFLDIINRICEYPVDIAFFPVDPRLGKFTTEGAQIFIDKVKPKYFIPMHFSENVDKIEDYIKKLKLGKTKLHLLKNPGDKIEVKM
ncbi:MAG: MBL fold metallo-hydrolase [Tissierellia bacterium]|nr:MBL fold metallo-hydrolase [Tissierellia bacterium]